MRFIAYLNANPGVAILLAGGLTCGMLAIWIGLGLRRIRRDAGASRNDAERANRRRQAELLDHMERADQRLLSDMQLLGTLLSGASKNNEERIDKMLDKLASSIEQQRREAEMLREQFDRRLQSTLEKRLGESFRQVSQQLERVYKGLGEMQQLATGVGDLKRVLTGVKTRGIWGEAQLGAILNDILTPEQFRVNTTVAPNAAERVEFAVVLPGKSDAQEVLLPIDAKFPQEDYERLLRAQADNDAALCASAGAALEKAILREADRIRDKYIRVPYTTDFAILFLPIEGLYAEALRRATLREKAQEKHILLAGPTTLAALLNSLQMGFQTLAMEKRTQEIWTLLGNVRTEFARFGEALDKAKAKLEQAGAELDGAAVRTRQITRQLRRMDELDAGEAREAGEAKGYNDQGRRP